MKLTIGISFLAFLMTLAQANSKSWTFDTDLTGRIASGFTNDVGEWVVAGDSTASSKPNVLAQMAVNDRPVFNVALISDTSVKDLDLSVRMKSVAGSIDQGGGLVWRAKDAKNYHIARYNPLENNYRVYKVEDGRRVQFANPTSPPWMVGIHCASRCSAIIWSVITTARNTWTFATAPFRGPDR